jgi:hypothetical protein
MGEPPAHRHRPRLVHLHRPALRGVGTRPDHQPRPVQTPPQMTPVKRRMNLRYAPRGLANPVAGMVIAHLIVFVGGLVAVILRMRSLPWFRLPGPWGPTPPDVEPVPGSETEDAGPLAETGGDLGSDPGLADAHAAMQLRSLQDSGLHLPGVSFRILNRFRRRRRGVSRNLLSVPGGDRTSLAARRRVFGWELKRSSSRGIS